jgi:hypothetical protein
MFWSRHQGTTMNNAIVRHHVVIFPKYEKTTSNSCIIHHHRVVFASVKEEDKLGSSFFSCSKANAKK